jgi:benzoyl-CoA reductase/2-hydroxyglutaryl-CoA dehydratase subunit BcrC/BadD/HgdB
MNLVDPLVYHLNVDLIGKAALRLERVRSERKLRRPGFWKHEHLSPPLGTSPRLKELISRHYLAGRYYEKKGPVAWVTSGAPMEFLKALDFFLMYPENHGAVCGIRRVADEQCAVAEDAGYSRDLCSYARTDFGTVLSGRTPVGRLPKPDLLVCCTNICQTVLYWYQVLAHHFRAPLVLIDTPFIYREASDHSVRYVERQLEEVLVTAERVAGRSIEPGRLRDVIQRSREAVDLWLAVMECGKAQPSPITAFDEFIHMAPIVEMRGEQYTVDYYRALLDELSERIRCGIGALKRERKRLIWDNLPIWHRVRPLAEALAERGVALVGSTYTNAWGELGPLIRPEQGLAGMARVYLHAILNRGTGYKLETMRKMVRDYRADGVILHSDRSCKPYSIGQIDQRHALGEHLGAELGVPALLLEGDHNDSRALSPAQIDGRLAAFLEMLGA